MTASRDLLWNDKYAPLSLSEIIGNEEAITQLKTWALEFERNKPQKPLLLYGPPGTGKTASARALAQEFNWTVIETNASDARDPKALTKVAGQNGKGLFNEQRLILLDEIDGAFDRGEVPEVVRIIKETKQPIILTANDVWDKHLMNLRSLCKLVEFKKVNMRTIATLLTGIAQKESVTMEKLQIDAIAKNSSGDVRSAIIDLQSGGVSTRDREANVFEAVRNVFKTTEYQKSINASEHLDIDLDSFIKWIEENVPVEYEKREDVQKAFDWLSKADIMQGRIRRRQYYGLMKYIRAYSHAGVSLSKKEQYHKFTPYQFPALLRMLSASKAKRAALSSLSSKIAKTLHCSKRKANDNLVLLAPILTLQNSLDLSEEEQLVLKEFSGFGNQLVPHEKKKRKNKQ